MLTRFLVIRVGYKSASFIFIFGLLAHAAVALPFVVCDKRKQKHALSHRAERAHNHRRSLYKLIFILLFLLTFSVSFNRCLSVIMRFLLPASRVVFSAHLCFKTALFYCDRYFLLVPRFVHFALPSAPVYSLLAPVVAIGCFYGVSLLASLTEGGGFALAKSEGVVLRSAFCTLRSNS